MIDLEKRERARYTLLKKLEELSEKYPNLRVGQLILNAVAAEQLYYLENEELQAALEKLYEP